MAGTTKTVRDTIKVSYADFSKDASVFSEQIDMALADVKKQLMTDASRQTGKPLMADANTLKDIRAILESKSPTGQKFEDISTLTKKLKTVDFQMEESAKVKDVDSKLEAELKKEKLEAALKKAKKKPAQANIDTGSEAELNSPKFEMTKANVQTLFKNSKVTENGKGLFTIETPYGKKLTISSEGNLTLDYQSVKAGWGKDIAEAVRKGEAEVTGLFEKGSNGISAIKLLQGAETHFRANHELFHAAVSMFMSDAQWNTLKSNLAKGVKSAKEASEIIADKYATFKEGRLKTTPVIQKIFNKIGDAMDSLRQMVTGTQSERGIFRDIESGKMFDQDGGVDVGQDTQAKAEQKERKAEVMVDRSLEKNAWQKAKEAGKEGGPRKFADYIGNFLSKRITDDTWGIREVFGAKVHRALEMGIAGAEGKGLLFIEKGAPKRGTKGLKQVMQKIGVESHQQFENMLGWMRYSDIASARGDAMADRKSYMNLAQMEKTEAQKIKRDYSAPGVIMSSEDLKQYQLAEKYHLQQREMYLKEAMKARKMVHHKQSQVTASEYKRLIMETLNEHPDWAEHAKDIQAIARDQLTRLKDAGIVSQEAYDRMIEANPNYVPLMRNIDKDSTIDSWSRRMSEGILDIADPTHRYTGGNENFLSPIEQIIYNESRVQKLLGRQAGATEMAKQADAGNISNEIIRAAKETDKMKDTESDFYIYREGKRHRYIIDKNIAQMVKAFDGAKAKTTFLEEALMTPGRILRAGVVRSPAFIVTNMIRDSFVSSLVNPHVRPLIDTARGLYIAITKDSNPNSAKLWDDFMEHGGQQSATWGYIDKKSKEYLDYYKGGKEQSLANRRKLKRAYDWLGDMAELSEESTRLGSYLRMVDKGINKDEAGFRTIDQMWFKRGGTWMKQMNKFVPFSNACSAGYILTGQGPI